MKTILTAMVVALCAIGLMVSCTPDVNVAEEMLNNQGHILVKTVGNVRSLKPGEHIYQLTNGIADKDVASKIMKTFNLDADQIVGLEFSDVSSIESSADSVFGALSNLAEVKADKNLQTIGANAFAGCANIGTIDLEGAKTISASAFRDCSSVESISLPSATAIGDQAFAGCSELKQITLPCAETIGQGAFDSCAAITSVRLDSVTSVGAGAFSGCTAITTVKLDNAESIGDGAFSGCSAITSLQIDNAKEIGESAFQGCSAITTLNLPGTQTIAEGAFDGCSGITSVEFGVIKTIAKDAFSGVDKLTTVSFPETIEKIEGGAFKDSNFTSVKFEGNNAPLVNVSAFEGTVDKDSALDYPGKDTVEGNPSFYRDLAYNFYIMGSDTPVQKGVIYNILQGQSAYDETEKAELEAPYDGYKFKCWSESSESIVDKGLTSDKDNASYYAVYEKKAVITFDGAAKDVSGEEAPIESDDTFIIVAKGNKLGNIVSDLVEVKLPDETKYSRTGYTFVGWRDEAAGKDYRLGDTVKSESSDIVLSAKWNANPYPVSFAYKDYGKTESAIASETTTVDYESAVSFPEAPDRSADGWTFVGWSKTEAADAIVAPEYVCDFTAAQKFYAIYGKETVIRFNFIEESAKEAKGSFYNSQAEAEIDTSDYKGSTWSSSKDIYVAATVGDSAKVTGSVTYYEYGEYTASLVYGNLNDFSLGKIDDTQKVHILAGDTSDEFKIMDKVKLGGAEYAQPVTRDYYSTTRWEIDGTEYEFGSEIEIGYLETYIFAVETEKTYTVNFHGFDKTTSALATKTYKYTEDNAQVISEVLSDATLPSEWKDYMIMGWSATPTGLPETTTMTVAYKTSATVGSILAANKTADAIDLYIVLGLPTVNFNSWAWIDSTKVNKAEITSISFVKSSLPSGKTATFYIDENREAIPAVVENNEMTVYLGSLSITPKDNSMYYAFAGFSALESVSGLGNLDLSKVTSFQSAFDDDGKLTSIDLSNVNTSSATNMSYMFRDCSSLTELDLSDFSTGKVTTMSGMFKSAGKLSSITYGEGWDTSKVTDFSIMFFSCKGFTTMPIANFNTSSGTNFYDMFNGCAITSIDVSHFDVSKAENLAEFFRFCTKLTTVDISSWDTSSCTNMSEMFYTCYNLETIYVGSGWDTSKVTSSRDMFGITTVYGSMKLPNWNKNYVNVSKAHTGAGGYLKTR